MPLTNILTKLINSFVAATAKCFGTDKETHESTRSTKSFVAIYDICCDDSTANNTQCCPSNASGVKPMAGSTTVRLPSELLDDLIELRKAVEKQQMLAWLSSSASDVYVRGEQYDEDKMKMPSSMSLYELVEFDAVHSNSVQLDLGEKYNLDAYIGKGEDSDVDTFAQTHSRRRSQKRSTPKKPVVVSVQKEKVYDTAEANEKTWNAPSCLIISFLLPTTAPKITQQTDEKGYICTAYYRMRKETESILRIISNPKFMGNEESKNKQLSYLSNMDATQKDRINAVKLWEKWCTEAPNNPEMQKRLKFIPKGNNLQEIGVPSWICKYNGKPMLIKRPGVTSFVFSHYNDDRMEIDINLHPLPFLFKQAMNHLHDHYFKDLIMSFTFLIESRENDELPEVLLGNPIILPFVKTEKALRADNVFS